MRSIAFAVAALFPASALAQAPNRTQVKAGAKVRVQGAKTADGAVASRITLQ